MSYDFSLLRPRYSTSPLEDIHDAEQNLPMDMGKARALIEQLKLKYPQAEVGEGEDFIEMVLDEERGLQFSIYPKEAALTFPYWEGNGTAAHFAEVFEILKLAALQLDAVVFDPQSGALVDLEAQELPGAAVFGKTLGAFHQYQQQAQAAPVAPQPTKSFFRSLTFWYVLAVIAGMGAYVVSQMEVQDTPQAQLLRAQQENAAKRGQLSWPERCESAKAIADLARQAGDERATSIWEGAASRDCAMVERSSPNAE